MKKVYKLILLALFAIIPTITFATSDKTIKEEYYINVTTSKKVYDYASILSDQAEATFQKTSQEMYEKYKIDLVVMTTNLEIKETTYSLAQGFYYTGGFGYGDTSDGIILVIDTYHREHYVLTVGKAMDVLTETKVDQIQNKMDKDMREGNYNEALNTFTKQTKKYYSYHNYGPPLLWIGTILFGISIAYFEVQREKRKLKLVTDSLDASYYYDDNHIDFKNETLINKREVVIDDTSISNKKTHNHGKNSTGRGRKF